MTTEVEMEDIIKRGYKCKRCGHGWEPRAFAQSLEIPTTCPKCKSPYWNKERRVQAQKKK